MTLNSTVAIVGTHPNTRDKAPWQDLSKDIWVFNNQILQGWCPRATACFDMHPPEDIHRRSIEHPQFGAWLKAEKGMKYYTPFAMPEIPNNVVYPKDQIVKALLGKFRRGENVNKYFTSGPCYALAMAIFSGHYKRIEMYGIEMESNAEYIYQRDGVGLWAGIAVGRGITYWMPPESMMFYAPLYGYEMDATVLDREFFEVRASEIQQGMDNSERQYHEAKGHLDALTAKINKMKDDGNPDEEIKKLGPEYQEAVHVYEQSIANAGFLNGQYVLCKMLLGRIDKALEYNGHAQEILAQNDNKDVRITDKIDLTHSLGGQKLPG